VQKKKGRFFPVPVPKPLGIRERKGLVLIKIIIHSFIIGDRGEEKEGRDIQEEKHTRDRCEETGRRGRGEETDGKRQKRRD
jgi:hypothetical protein